jgi:hypothetical protein
LKKTEIADICEQRFKTLQPIEIGADRIIGGYFLAGTRYGDFTESATDLLNGPARIAALWDDLKQDAYSEIRITHGYGDCQSDD